MMISLMYHTLPNQVRADQKAPYASYGATAEERAVIEQYLLPLPTRVQAAIAVLQGDFVRYIGAEKSNDGIRYLDNRRVVFEIGSITKVFTATLLAQQVQEGTLRLDQPVKELLPFTLHESAFEGVEVTLRHLASHISGMCHQPPGLNFHALIHFHLREPFKCYDGAKFQNYLQKKMELDFTPGERYQYSNMGMSLVGLILSRQAGKSYEALLQERIFQPLGMVRSSTDLNRVKTDFVVGIEKEGVEAPHWDMHALAPAGGIITCAEDFAAFIRTQFEPDAALVLTQTPVFTIEDGYYVGLGWHIIDRLSGERWLNHGGGMGGYTASVNVNVTKHCAVIVLANLGNAHKLAENISQIGRELLKKQEQAASL